VKESIFIFGGSPCLLSKKDVGGHKKKKAASRYKKIRPSPQKKSSSRFEKKKGSVGEKLPDGSSEGEKYQGREKKNFRCKEEEQTSWFSPWRTRIYVKESVVVLLAAVGR